MTIDTVVGELIGHYPPRSIIDEDIEAIRTITNLVGDFSRFLPVAQISLDPFEPLGLVLAQFLGDGFDGPVDHVFRDGDDEDFGDIVGQEGVYGAVADTF